MQYSKNIINTPANIFQRTSGIRTKENTIPVNVAPYIRVNKIVNRTLVDFLVFSSFTLSAVLSGNIKVNILLKTTSSKSANLYTSIIYARGTGVFASYYTRCTTLHLFFLFLC